VAASNFELTVSAENLDIAFNYLDTDGSGKISATELKNQLGTNIPE
jgi:Ca2+-binding EF-hand superfamily protein